MISRWGSVTVGLLEGPVTAGGFRGRADEAVSGAARALDPAPETTERRRRGKIVRVVTWVLLGFAGFMIVGNGAILAATAWARASADASPAVSGVRNFRTVDPSVSRGAAPTAAGYEALAAAGVTAVVDLRAESVGTVDVAALESMGVAFTAIPIRDGQTPTEAQVRDFLAVVDTVRSAGGHVFVHCGAGVGRTGAMVAAYLKATDQATGSERVRHNLSVGPPSLEQIVYAGSMDEAFSRPAAPVVAASRVLDAPRRIWHNLT